MFWKINCTAGIGRRDENAFIAGQRSSGKASATKGRARLVYWLCPMTPNAIEFLLIASQSSSERMQSSPQMSWHRRWSTTWTSGKYLSEFARQNIAIDSIILCTQISVAQAYINQKRLDAEAKQLHISATNFAKQTQQWMNLIEGFSSALKVSTTSRFAVGTSK